MNIDNNIGGAPHQGRSQPVKKVQTEATVSEAASSAFSGSTISFVNAMQSTSLASVLWTVNRNVAEETITPARSISVNETADGDAAWVHQAYTEH